MGDNRLPLSHIRVIDLTISWAGPKVTQVLADLGAEVIKVESIQWIDAQRGRRRPPRGMPQYPNREPGARPWNRSQAFNQLNRNKLSSTLDLSHPQGRQLFLELVKLGDVVVDCFSARVMDKFGLGYEQLRAVRPDIIVMSMPGFGKTGPYWDYLCWGSMVDCIGGQAAIRGYPDGEPFMPLAYGDPISGLTGAFAVMAALHYRERTGQGQFIDFSQLEAFTPLSAEALMDFVMNRRLHQPMANHHPTMAPHNLYPCQGDDRWVAIAVATDSQWQALCAAIGRPDLAHDQRYADVLGRRHHQAEIDDILREWCLSRSPEEVTHTLQQAGVPAGPVMNHPDLYHDPHLRARGFFSEVHHPDAGSHPYAGPTWKLSESPARIRRPAPCLGEHNAFVFAHLLGLPPEEVERLEAERLIGQEPLEGADS